MKRFRFVCAGLMTALCLFGIGRTSLSVQPTPSDAQSDSTHETASVISETVCTASLPCRVLNAPLTLQALGDYEGPFLEDGTDEETVSACAVLENTSDDFIEYAKIIVRQNGNTLVFEVTFLPPYAKVLVIEKNKQPFVSTEIDGCFGEQLSYVQFQASSNRIYVSGDGDTGMIITNLTAMPAEYVRIYFKQYIPESGLYFGGITYTTEVFNLPPEESRKISPYHYLTDRCRIVAVMLP